MTLSITPSSPVVVHRSPWHSPVPYLFAGFACMLSLISFALMILACSYAKQAREEEENAGDGETDLEAGDSKLNNELPSVFEEKYLVIMAGEAKPTFLATPISSSALIFCKCSCRSDSTESSSTSEVEKMGAKSEKEKQGSSDQVLVRNTENQETTDHLP